MALRCSEVEGAWFGGMPDHIPRKGTKVVSRVSEREVILVATELRFPAEISLEKHAVRKSSTPNPFTLLHMRFTKPRTSVLRQANRSILSTIDICTDSGRKIFSSNACRKLSCQINASKNLATTAPHLEIEQTIKVSSSLQLILY